MRQAFRCRANAAKALRPRAEKNFIEGGAFTLEYAGKEGARTLANGLWPRLTKEGTGKRKAEPEKNVKAR